MSLPLFTPPFSKARNMRRALAAMPALLSMLCGAAARAQTDAASTPAATAGSTGDVAATAYRGGPNRTGFTDQDVAPPLSIAWQNTVAALTGNQSTPVSDNGMVFFGDAGSVYAMNASDGSIKWSYPAADALGNPDVAHPGLFDCPATVADGKVYIGNDDNNLYALDESTGALVWKVTTGGYIRSAPVVQNGVVYFGSGDSKLYAIREDNQQPVWGGEFRTSGQITVPPAVTPSNVYFVDGNQTLYSAALASGRMMWSLKFQNNIGDSPPIFANGTVIVGSQRDLYGIAPSTGTTRWHFLLPADLTAQVALSGDGSLIYAATADDDIVALDHRGQVQWSAPLGSETTIAPVVTNSSVIAVTNSGIVRVLDSATGAVRWSYPLFSLASPRRNAGSKVSAVPLVTSGAIYTLEDNGTLTAFRRDGTDDLPPSAALVNPVQNKAVAGDQIPYAVFVNDIGTGVDPSSVAAKVDGSPLPVVYDPDTGYITVRKVARSLGSPVPVSLPTLTSGTHALTLAIADWRGNKLNKTWNFSVNDALNAPGSALPPAGGSSGSDTAPSSASAPSAPDNSASDGAAPGGADSSGSGSGGASSSGGSGTGSTSGAQPTGSAGGQGAIPSPASGSGPTPSTPTGPGAVPAAPAGSTGFPPAPPI